MKRISVTLAAGTLLVLTACSGPTSPPVESIAPKPSASATEAPADEPGTRENPLAISEQRKLSAGSMWSVGAEAATQVGNGYVVLPLHLNLDWDAAKAQGMPEGEGVDPWTSLFIEYITASGRSYDTWDTYVEVPNQIHDVGTVYPPLEEVSTNYVVTLPDADIAGGVWKVSNSNGESVFVAAE